MCGLGSKPAPVAPAPPPPPPAPEPPRAPAFTEDRRSRERETGGAERRRVGRSALRIDLQAPTKSGQGLQLPNK